MPDFPRIILHDDQTDTMAVMLRAAHPNAGFRSCTSYAALPALIADYRPDIVYSIRFAGTPGFPRDALFGAHGPKWLAIGGAGTDHLGQWDAAQTTVTNAAGVAADMMAEYAFGTMLHFTLDIPGLEHDKTARTWAARQVSPLKGKTLLIIGLGHTGQAVARRAGAFGMQVLGTRATPEAMENVDEVHSPDALMALLPRADFIVICCPLVASTRGMIGPAQIAVMNPRTILIDVSRGGVTDQSALAQALQKGQIAGAALDVFEIEPLPQDSPLWSLKNLIISPHCASVHAGWETDSFRFFLQNLSRWQRGLGLLNTVDPTRGY